MIVLKVKLKSDFRDFYDLAFDAEGYEFKRFTWDGLARPAMLTFLAWNDYNPPRHGFVRDLAPESAMLVVYTDEKAHRGEGKILMTAKEAMEHHPNAYASEYIQSPPESLRLLQVGMMRWMLSYKSDDAWRSNVGKEVEIQIVSEHVGYSSIPLPLFAIDFVCDKNGIRYAVDFNIAPGLKWTGIEDRMKPEEVVELIRQAIVDHKIQTA